jgi:hypothetical protein
MLPEVVEDVDQRVPHLARRPQKPRMVPIRPNPTMTAQRAIHRLRHTHREAAHTTIEPRRRIRLQQQMDMISLNAELKNPEPVTTRRSERRANAFDEPLAPEGADVVSRA